MNRPHGSAHHCARFTPSDVLTIRQRAASGDRLKDIAAAYPHASKVAVHYVITGRSWKHAASVAA